MWRVGLLVLAAGILTSASAEGGTFPVDICGYNARVIGDGLSSTASRGITANPTCPGGLEISAGGGQAAKGASAGYKVTAPPGIVINAIHVVTPGSAGVGSGKGWWGEFYWNGGPGPAGRSGQITDGAYPNQGCCSSSGLNSQSIGWFVACEFTPSCSNGVDLLVGELDLTAVEDRAPYLLPTTASGNLWTQSGWVRGTWPASVALSDPSGVCSAGIAFGGQGVNLGAQAPNRQTFVQCSESGVPASFNTATIQGSGGVGVGSATLVALATNAAGVTAHPSKTVSIDNSTPTVALSGPTDAPSTAGTQYVTASAGGSPSGIAAIGCSVDGGPVQSYPGATAQVPVSGVGQHTVNCYSVNNAVDPSGAHGQSPTANWGVKIGQPTIVGVAFDKLEGLNCRRARVRVRIPGHWITVRRRGKLVKVKTRSRTVTKRLTRCHPRTVRRRTVVFVAVRRHGKIVRVKRIKVVRVVIPPRVVSHGSRVVAFGHGTTVNGWLGTSTGIALPGRNVQVLAAPDNGSGQFAPVATVSTAGDGSWSAQLPPGPSRVIEALYNGDPTTESASSGHVRVIVPAKVRLLSVSPRRVAWGGTVRITGQLLGGYLPAGGALVRLRIGTGRSYQTYGVQEHVTGSGRFSTTYTFGAGLPGVFASFSFQVATLPMGDYPYRPAASGRRSVLVGGHPRSVFRSGQFPK